MLGSRAKLILLTCFFTFTFSIMFLALAQNYANASAISPVSAHAVVDTSTTTIPSEIFPTFGLSHDTLSFDFDSDDSFQKYLNADHPFADTSYVPIDLIPIDSHFTANNSKAFKLRQEAAIYFADMAWHFWNAFSGDRLLIVSAYRSKGFQDYLIKQGCSLIRCAAIGTSEHQAGLALDLGVVSKGGKSYSLDAAHPNKYYDRLKNYAAEYGFHNTYQKGVAVDGKMSEGWHWRYLGTPLAELLAENNQTFAEYYKTIQN